MAALGTAVRSSIPAILVSSDTQPVFTGVSYGAVTLQKLNKKPVVNPAVPTVGVIWPTGSPVVNATMNGNKEMREDTGATYSYIGTAIDGTAESGTGWTIARILLTAPFTVTHATGIWDNRTALTYT